LNNGEGEEAHYVTELLDEMPDCDEVPEGVVDNFDEVPDISVYASEYSIPYSKNGDVVYSLPPSVAVSTATNELYYYDEPTE
jgi:hypothetical protein